VPVTWTAVAHATSYTVWKNSTTTPVANVTTTSYKVSTLSNGTYTFEVSATFGTKWKGTKRAASAVRRIASSTPKCS
jgi:hypothetical protein